LLRQGPLLSVVIPTYNRSSILPITLPTILRQDFPAERREVIVVVDGSNDGTVGLLREPVFADVRVIQQLHRGQAAARNTGIRAARGRLILLLDDDMQCDPTIISRHVAVHRDQDRLIVEGGIALSPDSNSGLITEWWHKGVSQHFEQLRSLRDERWPWHAIRFANTSAPRSLLLDCGGFDERFRFAHEDLELGLRLSLTGAVYKYIPELEVQHVHRKSAHELLCFDAPWYGRNHLLLCRAHPEYRRHSPLAKLRRELSIRSRLRIFAIRLPLSLELLFRPAFTIAAKMGRLRCMRSAAMRLFGYSQALGSYRGARDAAGSWERLRCEFGMRLPVLTYHHVGPLSPGANYMFTLSPVRFRKQMNWLARRGFAPISPSDWVAWCREGRPLPEKPVMITFDDGYADVAEYALPEVQRHGFTATVFVVTSLVGETNKWDESAGCDTLGLMSKEQIREWAKKGISFGSHSRTHPDLTVLNSCELAAELEGSAKDLEDILGHRPTSFAYPYGRLNDEVRNQVSRIYDISFTTLDGMNSLPNTEHCLMRRLGILPQDALLSFIVILGLGFRPLDRLRSRVRLRTRLRAWLLRTKHFDERSADR
jgi:peptidoglycan/xylan/chitin deacetylase (PgdA/CDA1 family)/GT2 family glycosyltransferase